MSSSFKILGSSAGPGVPSFFCDCCGCREARENPNLARTRSGALLTTGSQNLLIDTSPDLRMQLVRERIDAIDGIFMTHWHFDHFGGLGELEYYVKLVRKQPIALYLPPSAVQEFAAAFPELVDIFQVIPWQFGNPCSVGALTVTPLPAIHSVETAGFLIESASRRLAYFPDTADLESEVKQLLQQLDWFICDATFTGENWFPNSHMSIAQAIELGQKISAKSTILTHLAVHYSQAMTDTELQQLIKPYSQVQLAYDGMCLVL
jgi:phosphoribosyl 1,2-cyclic phosphate phosphodiesterase